MGGVIVSVGVGEGVGVELSVGVGVGVPAAAEGVSVAGACVRVGSPPIELNIAAPVKTAAPAAPTIAVGLTHLGNSFPGISDIIISN